jgi:2-dehydro-3-deoxyphosphogluconate aldolase/(4S)-4-hydroxy-2-oxoglutarate aldolase
MTALDRTREEDVVAVLRRILDVDSVVDELVAGGIRIVEITLDSDDALGAIERLPARPDLTANCSTSGDCR